MLKIVLLSLLMGMSCSDTHAMLDDDIPTLYGKFDAEKISNKPYLQRLVIRYLRNLVGRPVPSGDDQSETHFEEDEEELSCDPWLAKQLEHSGWVARNIEKILRFLTFTNDQR